MAWSPAFERGRSQSISLLPNYELTQIGGCAVQNDDFLFTPSSHEPCRWLCVGTLHGLPLGRSHGRPRTRPRIV